jgi:hypothetical protein
MRFSRWLQTHSFGICNNCCLCFTTMVGRIYVSVRLYIHCLSCSDYWQISYFFLRRELDDLKFEFEHLKKNKTQFEDLGNVTQKHPEESSDKRYSNLLMQFDSRLSSITVFHLHSTYIEYLIINLFIIMCMMQEGWNIR